MMIWQVLSRGSRFLHPSTVGKVWREARKLIQYSAWSGALVPMRPQNLGERVSRYRSRESEQNHQLSAGHFVVLGKCLQSGVYGWASIKRAGRIIKSLKILLSGLL